MYWFCKTIGPVKQFTYVLEGRGGLCVCVCVCVRVCACVVRADGGRGGGGTHTLGASKVAMQPSAKCGANSKTS